MTLTEMKRHIAAALSRLHPSKFKSRAATLALGIAMLTMANALMFSRHYWLDSVFPWDFLGPYYAVPYYWIEVVLHGASVAWVPFQGMGYPLYINVQSAFFYPPLWIHILLHESYSVHAAVLLQGAHVLLAALGAGLCARLMGMRWSLALIAGAMYQCFGGFYSNSSHPDIVRAYAWLPWLCAPVFAQWQYSVLLRLSIAALPLFVYALCTGGYSGGVVAVLFVLGLTVLVRLVRALGRPKQRAIALREGILIGMALIAGFLMAGVALVPPMLDRTEIDRVANFAGISYDYFKLKDIFAFAFPVETPFFDHDVTMRSLFVGLPVIGLVLIRCSLGRMRQAAVLLGTGALAMAMASGWLHSILIAWLTPLGYSRFVMADYRGFIGLVQVLFAVQALQLLSEGLRPAPRWRHVWIAALIAYVFCGLLIMKPDGITSHLIAISLVLTASLLWWAQTLGQSAKSRRLAVVAGLLVLTLADWGRVVWDAPYFSSPGRVAALEAQIGSFVDTRAALDARLLNPPACRPARVNIAEAEPARLPWLGYYTGQYMTQDYSGPMKLLRHRLILASESLIAFSMKAWTAVALPTPGPATIEQLVTAPIAGMDCVQYGTTHLQYKVHLDAPTLVVENEVYWPGWSASLKGTTITAVEVHGFRGWQLPAGEYTLRTDFHTPHLKQGIIVSLLGLFLWLAVIIALLLSHRHHCL